MKGKIIVPPTKRYCRKCERMRKFVYDPAIGHSRCDECGGRYSYRYNPILEFSQSR